MLLVEKKQVGLITDIERYLFMVPLIFDILVEIISNPLYGLLVLVVAVISLVAAIYFGIKSIRVKSPRYRNRSTNIVTDFSNKVQSIQILSADKPVANLTVTNLVFWNAGRDPIRKQDIASADPLRITCNDQIEILEAKVIQDNNKPSQFSISTSSNPSELLIQFDFLEKNQGGVIQLFHTGKSGDEVELRGTIIGAVNPKIARPSRFFAGSKMVRGKHFQWFVPLLITSIFAVGVIIGGYLILFLPPLTTQVVVTNSNNSLAGWLILFSYVGLGLALTWSYGTQRIPKGLDQFEDQI